MQATLEDFFRVLRGSDLEVSLNAQLDAARAVELVGWQDRTLLKSALGTTLAKTIPDRALCDDVFDRFFHFDSFEETLALRAPSESSSSTGPDEALLQADDDSATLQAGVGSGGPGGGGGQALSQLLLSGDLAALAKRMQEAAREVGLSDIWFFTQKGYYTQMIQQAMGLESLQREIDDAQRETGTQEHAGQLDLARKRLFAEVRNYVERKLALYGTVQTLQLHDRYLQSLKLSHVERRDFERMYIIVHKIAKRLASRHARRKKRRVRGQLDFRKTLRKNVAYDGVMFETFWRNEVVDRPRVIAICDVSSSMSQYARFLLLFLYSLGEEVTDLRSFAFTNHLVDVSETFESLTVEQAIDKVIRAVGGSGTDYGQVLLDIGEQLLNQIDRRSTVLILGDARNNRGEAQVGVMKLLYQRARRVIWLNPEPVSSWGTGDSEMLRYEPYCHIARECNSVKHIEYTLDALLSSHWASA
ncbi:MAG: VWA domain-containing protein [Pseudomonadota bacterium]